MLVSSITNSEPLEKGRKISVTYDDYQLIENVRAGDKESFAVMVQKYTPYVYKTAYALVNDRPEAEDISQEVFLKVYRSINKLSDTRAFNSWLKKVVTHCCLDNLKKRRAEPIPDAELDRTANPVYKQLDERLVIREALKKLSYDYREILVLREWQGYDYREIADILKIPVGTVKSRLFSARVQLKKILDDQRG